MHIYQKILAVIVLLGLGAIFWAGTCLWEEIFRKKYHNPRIGDKILDKFISLILGIIFTVVLPFLVIDIFYQKFDAEIYWIFPRNTLFIFYYGISLLLWGLSFSIGRRRGKNY